MTDDAKRAALLDLLSDTEREIEDLQRVARFLRSRIGLQEAQVRSAAPEPQQPVVQDADIVSSGEYAGWSSREAAIRILDKVGRPITVDDLLRLLRRAGLELNGKHARNTLRRTLFGDPAFVHPTPRLWGLAPKARTMNEEGSLGLGE